MDYKEKYNAALERAKKEWIANLDNCYKNYRESLEIIFPELKESEDEKIRKGLINGFKECLEDCQYPKNAVKYWHNVKVDDILTWLERKTVDADKVVNWLDYNIDDVYDYDGRYISSTLKNKFKEDFKL